MADNPITEVERSLPARIMGAGSRPAPFLCVLATVGWLCSGQGSAERAWAEGTPDLPRPAGETAPKGGPSGEGASQRAVAPESEENDIGSQRLQGPALTVPSEIIDMLNQRKRHLDRREASLRGDEERLRILKVELEQMLEKHEKAAAAQKQQGEETQKRDEERKLRRQKESAEARVLHQSQLAKIYESMPPEEAAASLERMPERKAIEVLRILKGKSAGAILAAIRPERAARLTEHLLAPP
jgi:flagellar motility protein MotE (MotC chaperone)